MPADRFDVVFRGQLMEDQDPDQVRIKVGRLFKAEEAQLQRLFSGKPISIKRGVDMETASRYRLAFRQAGALVEIRAETRAETKPSRPTVNGPTASPATGSASFALAPANTGSLEDYAAKVQLARLPDISGLDLASPGDDHEQATETPAPSIEIDDLELVPGQDWSLEDCHPPPLPEVLPDISDLDLAAPDDTTHIPPEPPPLPLPDIGALSLEPVKDDDEDKT